MSYGGIVHAIVLLGFGSLALWIAYGRACTRKAQNREIANALEANPDQYTIAAAVAALRGEL